MKLTTNEREILQHRFDVSDALAEVLNEEYGWKVEVVEDCIDGMNLSDLPPHLGLLQAAILKDCCEGSTFFCDIEDAVARGELTKGKAAAYQRAANSLEFKFDCNVPRA